MSKDHSINTVYLERNHVDVQCIFLHVRSTILEMKNNLRPVLI